MSSVNTLLLLFILGLSACVQNPTPAPEANHLPNPFDRRNGAVALQDEQIEIQAREILSTNPEFEPSHVNVNTYNGLLLLTGETPTEELHLSIVEKLRAIPGVKRVWDELEIAPATDQASHYNDSTVTNRILTELDRLSNPNNIDSNAVKLPAGFNSSSIKIVTENGVVYLLGLVYRSEADATTKAVQQVPGVLKVVKLFEYFK